ncbi:MAG: DNA replication/repair protein RecF [Dehalococcoidia bacterium]
MRLVRLSLADYRNFHRLELDLPGGSSLFLGDNAQGKTNLLEAVYLLATMRHPRAGSDARLIRWQAVGQPLASARVATEAETLAGLLKVEAAIVARQSAGSGGERGNPGLLATKVVRVNGVPKRLADAVGQLTAVLFSPEDLDLIGGPPALRRRYLDITVSQVDRAYVGARQRYEKVLGQRNHLLRRLRERLARPDEITFWNDELVRDGSYIFWARARAVAAVGRLAASLHAELSSGESLRLTYQPCLGRLHLEDEAPALAEADPGAIADLFAQAQRRHLEREIAAGMTLLGPHRDDLLFLLGDVPAAGFASRAQQRTIALSLRLAEARYLAAERGEPPVLLLDDVLSEMDARRRRSLLDALAGYEQVLITATDVEPFSAAFLERASIYGVAGDSVSAGQPARP